MIRLCVFDLGGTIVDKFSLSPFYSLKRAFKNEGIFVPNTLIFKDMGKHKKDHIKEILDDEFIQRSWMRIHGSYPKENDVNMVFKKFCNIQENEGLDKITIFPETKSAIYSLQKNNILTGVTTGFNKETMNKIKLKLNDDNIYLNHYVSSTCLDKPSRPYPHMINNIMNVLNVRDPKSVIKIDDTVTGIEEGLNAGCISIGVTRWSSVMKMTSYDEINNLTLEEISKRIYEAENILKSAGAHYVIHSLDDLYPIIQTINNNYKSP